MRTAGLTESKVQGLQDCGKGNVRHKPETISSASACTVAASNRVRLCSRLETTPLTPPASIFLHSLIRGTHSTPRHGSPIPIWSANIKELWVSLHYIVPLR